MKDTKKVPGTQRFIESFHPYPGRDLYKIHSRPIPRIIENTPARTVIHWRYPLIDVNRTMANYNDTTGWCDMSDWYYYIYPDGVAVKSMKLWTHGERNHEWQESMAISGPDQHPEDIINTTGALTMLNLKNESKTYDWITGPPQNVSEPPGQVVQYVNYTGVYKPVTIGDFINADVYNGELTEYSVFPTWNHWPIAQMPSDGRYAIYPDRTAHSSLTHLRTDIFDEEKFFNISKLIQQNSPHQFLTKKHPVQLNYCFSTLLRLTAASQF